MNVGFPIKTSDDKWLEKALELFNKRISMSVVDDAHYSLDKDSDSLKEFKNFSLRHWDLIILIAFYGLTIVCAILFYLTISLQYARTIALFLSFLGFILCFGLPTYYLITNRPPNIIKTKVGIDIIFGLHKKDELEDDISKELSSSESKSNSIL